MSQFLYNVLKISGGGQMTQMPPLVARLSQTETLNCYIGPEILH